MKIKYLGTAAAEGVPAVFCDCENCKKSRKSGGKNIRTRSQALIDDRLLIDFPCDTYYHSLINNFNLTDISYCLITHIHEDHYYPTEFSYLRNGFSKPRDDWTISIYGSEDLESDMEKTVSVSGGHIIYNKIKPFEPFRVGKYNVIALMAYHGTPHPYFYYISDGEKAMLYAHDTDIFPDETWNYLLKTSVKLNFVSLDCTQAADENLSWHGHMCLERNIECRAKMLEYGLIDAYTPIVLNHFSHNGLNSIYDEFLPIAAKNGFTVSFDGMTVII